MRNSPDATLRAPASRGRRPLRLVGERARRLVADALAEARRRRPTATRGPVLEPFALIAQGEGSVEYKLPGEGNAMETLMLALAREPAPLLTVVVFEAMAEAADVFVLDLFRPGAASALRWIERIDEP